jgi:hypothetical protein
MADGVRIFISHSHADDAFTMKLVGDLRAAGADVWVDKVEIKHGDFQKRINDGMKGRGWAILVMTPDALGSEWGEREVNAALRLVDQDLMLAVLPVVAKAFSEADVPPLWGNLHRYDATTDLDTRRYTMLALVA